jgi:hypothetical protein
MNINKLRNALIGDPPEIVVTRLGRRLNFEHLEQLTAKELIRYCEVMLRGDPYYMREQEVENSVTGEKSGIIGFAYNWKSIGACPTECSKQTKNMTALDCVESARTIAKAYDGGI